VNRFGRIAQQYWTTYLPSRLAQIPPAERMTFFEQLGREVQQEIEDRAPALEGTPPPDEGYLETVGRLRMATAQAQEAVLAEMVYLPKEPGTEDLELDTDLPPEAMRP